MKYNFSIQNKKGNMIAIGSMKQVWWLERINWNKLRSWPRILARILQRSCQVISLPRYWSYQEFCTLQRYGFLQTKRNKVGFVHKIILAKILTRSCKFCQVSWQDLDNKKSWQIFSRNLCKNFGKNLAKKDLVELLANRKIGTLKIK